MHPTSSSLGGPLMRGSNPSSAPSPNEAGFRDAGMPESGSFKDSMNEASRPQRPEGRSPSRSRSEDNAAEARKESGPAAADSARDAAELTEDENVPDSAGILTAASPSELRPESSLAGSGSSLSSPTSSQSVLTLQENAGKSGLLAAAVPDTADAEGDMTLDPKSFKTLNAGTLDSGLNLAMTERARLSGLPVQLQIQLENTALAADAAPQPLLDPQFGSLFTRATSAAPGGTPSLTDVTATVQDGLRPSVPVSVTFGHEKWHQLAAERTVSLLQQGFQSAELMLDPPELGPLQVRIQIQNDQAVVQFASASAAVREALDQTIPRLREMLQEQGMSLLHAGVSDQSSGESSSREHGEGSEAGGDPVTPLTGAPQPETTPQVITLNSGIDDFA